MSEQVLAVPLTILISLLAPLYALVAGLYVLLFRHSTNEPRHFNQHACDETKAQMRGHIRDVDNRAVKAFESLKTDMTAQFTELFRILRAKE